MAHITQHYGIAAPVPFVDVDVDVDNRLFLDPHAIRLQAPAQHVAVGATEAIDSFFGEVARCAMSSDQEDLRRGLDLLQHFEEPWETRFGYADGGFHGHGGAEDVGSWIWTALTTDLNALLRVAVLRYVEDLPLFVQGVDRDITSDLTTRIAFKALAEFTQHMMEEFCEFEAGGNHAVNVTRQVWDCAALKWTTAVVRLPVVNAKPLLLVPSNWARPTLLMSASRFYDTAVLGYAQNEQATLSHDGKLVKTPKHRLRTQQGLKAGRHTNLAVTRRAHERDQNLIDAFRRFVDMRYEPLTDDEAGRATA